MAITSIVVFAFGSPATLVANRDLAEAAASCVLGLRAPVLICTQKEVPVIPNINPQCVRYITSDPKAQPTLRIARWAAAMAHSNSAKTIMVIAAGPHRWRAVRDVRYAVKEIKEIDVQWKVTVASINLDRLYPDRRWFCPSSNQSRSRSAMDWWPRELLLRCIPMRLYAEIVG